jgi:hypothetical protein
MVGCTHAVILKGIDSDRWTLLVDMPPITRSRAAAIAASFTASASNATTSTSRLSPVATSQPDSAGMESLPTTKLEIGDAMPPELTLSSAALSTPEVCSQSISSPSYL